MKRATFKSPFTDNCEEGKKLRLQIMSGEVYTCNLVRVTQAYVIVRNVTVNVEDEVSGGVWKIFKGDISDINVVEEVPQLVPPTHYLRNYYTDLEAHANNYILIDGVDGKFDEMIGQLTSLNDIAVIGEGVQFGVNHAINILVIGSHAKVYIFDIKRTLPVCFTFGLRHILSNGSMQKIVYNNEKLEKSLASAHGVILENTFDVAVFDQRWTEHKTNHLLEDVRPFSTIILDYLNLPVEVASKCELTKLEIETRPLSDDVLKTMAFKAACLFKLKEIIQEIDE